jgi:glycosyltransferase involved in cell wall biosynthesis
MAELVSILIPAYNAEKWIDATIKSALDQTWPNKEIIIVDDGSSDDTLGIIKKYESKKVKLVTQRNTGACGARNKALTFAQGSYIQWLDADDLLAPDKIAKQLENVEDGNSSLILRTAAFGTFYYRHNKAKFIPTLLWQNLQPIDWMLIKLGENTWMNPTSWIVSRKLTELSGPWDERLTISGDDDGEYILRVVAKSQGVEFVSESKCFYRIGNIGSLDWTMGTSDNKLESLLLSMKLSINHLLSLEYSDRTKRAIIGYLQTWLALFYPEKTGMVDEVLKLIQEMGGKMTAPNINWKYYPMEKLLGTVITKKIMTNWRKSKMILKREYDRMLFKINSNK